MQSPYPGAGIGFPAVHREMEASNALGVGLLVLLHKIVIGQVCQGGLT